MIIDASYNSPNAHSRRAAPTPLVIAALLQAPGLARQPLRIAAASAADRMAGTRARLPALLALIVLIRSQASSCSWNSSYSAAAAAASGPGTARKPVM